MTTTSRSALAKVPSARGVAAGEAAAQRAALGAVAGVGADLLLGGDRSGEAPARLAPCVVDLGAHEQADVLAGHAGGDQVGDGALGVAVLS